MSIARATPGEKARGVGGSPCIYKRPLPGPARPDTGSEQEGPPPHRDRGVGGVEGGEVMPPPVGIDEVDYVAEPQPVDHVAERAAHDEREPAGDEPLGR